MLIHSNLKLAATNPAPLGPTQPTFKQPNGSRLIPFEDVENTAAKAVSPLQDITPALLGLGGAGLATGLLGANIGGGLGAVTAPKDHRVESIGRGVILGAGAGLGATGGVAANHLIKALIKMTGRPVGYDGSLVGAGSGALLGGALARHTLGKPSWEKEKEKSAAFQMPNMTKISLDMGEHFGNAATPALLGLAAGGGYGAINPGEEVDENGVRRPKSRLSGALRGAALGGGAGLAGGLGYSYLQSLLDKQPNLAAAAEPASALTPINQ